MLTDEKSPQASEYVAAVNRAIDWILTHLEGPLTLEEVAEHACFSPFHFHRVFKSLTGETLAKFVKRVRLERAIQLAARAPGRSWTEIAHACGFSSSSDFSRSFKQHFGVAPSRFDAQQFRAERRERWTSSNFDERHRTLLERLPPGENPDNFEVSLVELQRRTVAYIRVPAPYREGVVPEATQRLVAWAEGAGYADNTWYGYMWDDPEVVAHEDCRYDVAVEVDADFRPDGDVGRFDFPAMTVASLTLRGAIDLEIRAIDWLFGTWLPRSGFGPSSHPSFEVWHGRPFAHGFEHFELDVHLPLTHGPGAPR